MNEFRRTLVLGSRDVDCHSQLKITSFMNYAQEVAEAHASQLGFGFDQLYPLGVMWVLSRMHMKVTQLPLWRSEVEIVTRHRGQEGLCYLRDFELRTLSGEVLVQATSYWLIINLQTRKIQRHLPEIAARFTLDEPLAPPFEDVLQARLARQACTLSYPHRVTYSDLDLNQHTNNTKYLEWALDLLDLERVTGFQIGRLDIYFNQETMLADEVEQGIVISNDGVYIEGLKQGQLIYQVNLQSK